MSITTTLQQGVSGYTGCADDRMDATYTTTNYGAHTLGFGGTYSTNRHLRELQRWSLASIPATAVCVSATLQLYHLGTNAGQTSDVIISIYNLLAANAGWVEGTGLYDGVPETGAACWAYKAYHAATPTNWAGSAGCGTADTDYGSTV